MCDFGGDGWSVALVIWYLQGLLTPVLALVAGYIAWRQWRTNDLKTKLDLFDRRFRIYDRVREELRTILQHGGSMPEEWMSFYGDTIEADFIFREDIREYISEILKRTERLVSSKALMDRGGMDPQKWAQEHQEDKKWMTDEVRQIRAKFKPYLDVSKL
jgi:hypothetical protein